MKKYILVLYILLVNSLFAVNYFVAPWGNDGYSGLSWDSAFATLKQAADIVAAGDSVFAESGGYVGFDLRTGGSASLPIVFIGYGDTTTIITQNSVTPDGINIENADWVVIDNFYVVGIQRAGIRVALSEHVVIKNNICSHNGRWGIFTGFADYAVIENNLCMYSQQEHGIYFSNSADHPVIRYNTCHHNYGNGIHMNGDESMGGDGLITDATVECNIIYENGVGGGSGINCDGVAESRIFNNLLYLNHSSGISLYQIDASAGSYNTKVYNNTIISASDGRWCLNINTDSYADTVYNNILINLHSWRGSIAIDTSSLPDFCSDYNIVVDRMSNDGGNTTMTLAQWQALGYDINSFLGDPLDSIFLNWSSGDYHLRENSQAIDVGTDLVSPIVQYDLDNVSRPQGAGYDIGAYEYPETGIHKIMQYLDTPIRYDIYQISQKVVFDNLHAGDHIKIYDIRGRIVHNSGRISGNTHEWYTSGLSAGAYFCVINRQLPAQTLKSKIVLIQ
jgi:parallel beta-helix repeat protein